MSWLDLVMWELSLTASSGVLPHFPMHSQLSSEGRYPCFDSCMSALPPIHLFMHPLNHTACHLCGSLLSPTLDDQDYHLLFFKGCEQMRLLARPRCSAPEYSDALRENHFRVWMLYHGFIKNKVIERQLLCWRITYHHFVRKYYSISIFN